MLQTAIEPKVGQERWAPIPEDFWKWIDRYTRWRARRASCQWGLNEAEIDDLQQELMIDLAKRWRWFDPRRSPSKAFVAMIVTNRLADMANNEVRRVRNIAPERHCESLDDEVRYLENGEMETSTRAQFVSEEDHRRRRQIRPRSDFERTMLQADVRNLVAKLPADLQQVCEAVMKYSVPDAARRLKIPESTLRAKLKRLRKHFADVRSYLDQPRR